MHGKEQIVNVLRPGEMFPHQGFFRQDNYPAHAEALDDIVLVYIPIQSFETFLITHPEICIKLFRVLGDIIVDLQNRLRDRKSTRLNSSHVAISYAVFCLKKKNYIIVHTITSIGSDHISVCTTLTWNIIWQYQVTVTTKSHLSYNIEL